MNDFLNVILARVEPALWPALCPVLEQLRAEYGGERVYIASSRSQRQRQIRQALQQESRKVVAQRFRVSRSTVDRLAR